jgi:lipopolysaccharide export system permease protein
MLCTKIWERHFLSEFTKSLFTFLAGFYALYVLIDYANHTSNFHRHNVQFDWQKFVVYYLCDFVRQLEVLLPFALLIASIRTLCNLNVHNELIALMSGGTSIKTLMQPFIMIGLLCTALMYINAEWILPKALEELKYVNESRAKTHNKYNHETLVQTISLEDGSTFIFSNYDAAKKMFYDTYWIRNIDDVYRIKYLYTNMETDEIPQGRFVEHLTRTTKGELTKTESFNLLDFPDVHFNQKTLFETISSPEEESLTALSKKLPANKTWLSEKEAQIQTAFYRKLVLPWFCLLAIIGPAPFCLRSTRQLPVFFIYAGSIFGMVAFYLLLSAATLLGKRQLIPAFWAIFPPVGFGGLTLLWRFLRL